jgi:hypothetical protein
MTQELSGQARSKKPRPSRVRQARSFDSFVRRSYPEGYGCYCADQNARTPPGGKPIPPPKGPGRRNRPGRARETGRRGAYGTGKSRKSSSIGRACKTRSPNCKANAA